MNRTKLLPVLVLAVAAPLAACSSGSSSSSSTTTPSTGASSVTTASASGGSGSSGTTAKGSTSGTAGGASATGALSCKDYAAAIPETFAEPVNKLEDLGGSCTATLGSGDKVEIVWNRFASNEGSFATVAKGLEAVKVTGATRAVGGFDDQGAQVKALVDGKGTYQLSLTPDYVSARATNQADVDKLAGLVAVLIAKG